MYVHSPFPNQVYALNLEDQSIRWKYEPKQDMAVIPVMCCDTVSRGVAYADGKIFLQQADTTLVALDAKTGKELWKVVTGDPKKGETATNTPHVFKDKALAGISGGEFGVRGPALGQCVFECAVLSGGDGCKGTVQGRFDCFQSRSEAFSRRRL